MKIYYDNESEYNHQILSYDKKDYDQIEISNLIFSILEDMYADPEEIKKWLVSCLFGMLCGNELEKGMEDEA